MERTRSAGLVLVCALAIAGCVPAGRTYYDRGRTRDGVAPAAMTAHDVIELSRAHISDSLIVTMITVSGSRFNLKTRDVIALSDSGVSHDVISAMVRMDDMPAEGDGSGGYAANYPPYYWYGGYYPFWDPWYYRAPGIGFRYRYYGFHGGFGRGFRFNGIRSSVRHR